MFLCVQSLKVTYHSEAVEKDDEAKVDQGSPGQEWLHGALENESVAVNALGIEGLLEIDVGNADAAPGEELGNGDQVLEPGEDQVGARATAHVGEKTERRSNCDAPVWNTILGALEQEARGLANLGNTEKITGAGVQESVTRRSG